MNYNFGGGRGEREGSSASRPSIPPKKRLYRQIVGRTEWTLLSETDNVKNDVAEITDWTARVRSGFFQPQQNPYSVQLSSGRILSFEWRPEPSIHACIISNIRYKGKMNDSILRLM
jgi:hypothetical protein